MKRTMINGAVGAATLATVLLGAGCTTTGSRVQTDSDFQRESQYLVTTELEGAEPREVRSEDYKFELEELVLHGLRMFAQPNRKMQPDELDIRLVLYSDHSLVQRDSNEKKEDGRMPIQSDLFYVPAKVKNESGFEAKRLTLATEGPYAVKAERTPINTNGIQTGVLRTTQDDLHFNIRTIFINRKEYYAPTVEEGRDTENSLPFYLIPVKGTDRVIHANGEIELVSREGIYLPMKETIFDYAFRDDPLETPKETTGKAKGIN